MRTSDVGTKTQKKNWGPRKKRKKTDSMHERESDAGSATNNNAK